ncbi:hypothetical protein MO973_26905 [Paenibacillus sp. TRM 82003]|nr:hypothetical protein [Paenibacillus sp. TRM 82003]
MPRKLHTDIQFERAYLARNTVYARDKDHSTVDRIGSLESFNPIFVTLSGTRLFRDDYDFLIHD